MTNELKTVGSLIQNVSDKNVQTISQKSINTDNKKAKLLANYVWPIFSDMYPIFQVKYGDTPSATWVACLKGINELQIKEGLAACLIKYPEYPPGAASFRSLCKGSGDASHIDFYTPKRIESSENKAKRRVKAQAEIKKLKNILK